MLVEMLMTMDLFFQGTYWIVLFGTGLLLVAVAVSRVPVEAESRLRRHRALLPAHHRVRLVLAHRKRARHP